MDPYQIVLPPVSFYETFNTSTPQLSAGGSDLLDAIRDVSLKEENDTHRIDENLAFLNENVNKMTDTINAVIDLTDEEQRKELAVANAMANVSASLSTGMSRLTDFMTVNNDKIMGIVKDINALKKIQGDVTMAEAVAARARIAANGAALSADMMASIPIFGGSLAAGSRFIARGLSIAADVAQDQAITKAVHGLVNNWKDIVVGKVSFSSLIDIISGDEHNIQDVIKSVEEHVTNISHLTSNAFHAAIAHAKRKSYSKMYMNADVFDDVSKPQYHMKVWFVMYDAINDCKVCVTIAADEANIEMKCTDHEPLLPSKVVEKTIHTKVFAPQVTAFCDYYNMFVMHSNSITDVTQDLIHFIENVQMPVVLEKWRHVIMKVSTDDPHVHSHRRIYARNLVDCNCLNYHKTSVISLYPVSISTSEDESCQKIYKYYIRLPPYMSRCDYQCTLMFAHNPDYVSNAYRVDSKIATPIIVKDTSAEITGHLNTDDMDVHLFTNASSAFLSFSHM